MAERQPEFVVDFPTLNVALCWAQHHCIVPDGFRKGEKFIFVPWQRWCLLNFYRVRPDAELAFDAAGVPILKDGHEVRPASAFHWRRSQVVMVQKAGKAPYTAAHICIEGVGPAVFAGWAAGGEQWLCSEHGCKCGWSYTYQPGEAMATHWPTPLVQITATSADQADNIYAALRPMIDDGPLHELIPKTGEEFIRLPGGGRIDPVSASATSRLGQRVTFVAHDETSLYWDSNSMVNVARTQRRGVTAMGGRSEETTNAWDPTQQSVAQRTADSKAPDIFRHHPLAPKGLSYSNKADRRKIHRYVYEGCSWIDLDAIEGDAAESLENDPAEAERFYGNRTVAGGGPAFDFGRWEKLAKPREVPEGDTIVIGVDGARYNDAIAVVACHVESGYVWPLEIVEKPLDLTKQAAAEYEHDQTLVDGAVREAFGRWSVWRLYADPDYLDYLMQGWKNEFGEKRVFDWRTYRPRPMGWAVRKARDAVKSGDMTHAGKEVLTRHVGNARLKELVGIEDDQGQPLHRLAKDSWRSPFKIDGAVAMVLAWEARTDAIEAGVVYLGDEPEQPSTPEPEPWTPGNALPLNELALAGSTQQPGDLS